MAAKPGARDVKDASSSLQSLAHLTKARLLLSCQINIASASYAARPPKATQRPKAQNEKQRPQGNMVHRLLEPGKIVEAQSRLRPRTPPECLCNRAGRQLRNSCTARLGTVH